MKIWRLRPRVRRKLPTPRLLELANFDPALPAAHFRLYRNEDIAMLSSKVMDVEMREPSCDNDCPTEVRLLENSARFLESQITDALTEFNKDRCAVKNLLKYGKKEGEPAITK